MCNVVRENKGHQNKLQHWDVIATEGRTVYIGFDNFCFKKHFVLASKKSKTPEAKMEKRSITRFRQTTQARKLDESIKAKGPEQRSIESRYGSGSKENDFVDLTILSHKEVLVEMAKTLIAHDFSASPNVEFAFSKSCVVHTDTAAEEGATSITYTVGSKVINCLSCHERQ
jgi:hypothetical protein